MLKRSSVDADLIRSVLNKDDPVTSIKAAFPWADTKEGHAYWQAVYDRRTLDDDSTMKLKRILRSNGN